MRSRNLIGAFLGILLMSCGSFSAADAQVNKIINNVRKGNFGQAAQQVQREFQRQPSPPKRPVQPPTPPPPTCPGKPRKPCPVQPPAPILPGPIDPSPIIPTPITPTPITPSPIIIHPGPPIPTPGPPTPSPVVPTPVVPGPIVPSPPTPTPTPPVVVAPTPPAPTPDPNANQFKNRPLQFVVQVPAQMVANGTVVPDTNAMFNGIQLHEQVFMPNFGGAIVRPGVKVGEGWMGCTYTMGPYNIPGHGYIVPVTP